LYRPAVPAELRISDPPVGPGVRPARPGAGIAPGPALLQALALLNQRLWPTTYTALEAAIAAYSESQPSEAVQAGNPWICVAGNAAAASHRPTIGNVPFQRMGLTPVSAR